VKVWHTVNVGQRWCLMTAQSVTGRCWLICAENTVIFSARSLGELLASVVAGLCRAIQCSRSLTTE
jgi:hypothetical protein